MRTMNRRDFLHPRHVIEPAAQLLRAVETPGETAPAADVSLLRFSRRAMATEFEVLFPCGTANALAAATAAFDEIDRLEDQLTVYREHSEVSQLNRRAAE